MASLFYRPASALARLVASGEMSAEALVQAHLDRIATVDPMLHAFVEVRAAAALAEARAQDARARRGEPLGPLAGVPVTVKSAIDVAGLRCETGSPSRAGQRAANDAVVVSRLRRAGAIVIGTTNVAEMLMGYETVNPLYGRTVNPWDLSRTPGGSSGGEAAAIAAGCSAGGIGSDGGGSIRVPAHFCGICGFKPTPGRIPTTGHQPPCLGPFSLLGVVGPMARSVADLALMDRVLAGWDAHDPMAVPDHQIGAGLSAPADPADLRIGFFEDDGLTPVTAETRAAVRAAVAAAERAGFRAEPTRPPVLAQASDAWDVLFCQAGAMVLHQTMQGRERDLPILRASHDRRPAIGPLSAGALTDAWVTRDLARAQLLEHMREVRVLVCPTAAIPAFTHDERSWMIEGQPVGYLEAMSYTQWFNVLGNPVVVVPVSLSAGGLPIGVQVVGRPYDDGLVLDVAAAIERGTSGYHPPPGLPV